MADKKTVIVMPHNHFDPSWRRCFDRKAKLGDTQVASYAEIEKQIIDRWLAYDQPFTEGQAALLRKYVEKRPENKAALSAMAKARKLACPLTGETVQDTNLPAPEGLVRNFLCALPFYRELAGGRSRRLRPDLGGGQLRQQSQLPADRARRRGGHAVQNYV